jgi:hypothetical protein
LLKKMVRIFRLDLEPFYKLTDSFPWVEASYTAIIKSGEILLLVSDGKFQTGLKGA